MEKERSTEKEDYIALRDQFAAAALQGMLANANSGAGTRLRSEEVAALAKNAYRYGSQKGAKA
jgi:hypothetical protein